MIKRRSVEINNDSSNVSNTSEDSTGSGQMPPQSTLYDESYASRSTTTRRGDPSRSGESSVNTSGDRQATADGEYSLETNSSGSRLVANDVQLADEPESKRQTSKKCYHVTK